MVPPGLVSAQDCGGICNPGSLHLGSYREGNEARDFFRSTSSMGIEPWIYQVMYFDRFFPALCGY